MAKSSKTAKSERQQVVDQMMAKQRSAERSRGLVIVGVCMLIALLIVGAAAYGPLKERVNGARYASTPLAELGAPAAEACQEVTTKEATGTQDHVSVGTPLTIADFPPAFGQHYDVWESMDDDFYTANERPDLGKLIHNMEHGYTILWYDETVADDSDQLATLRAMASKFDGSSSDMRNKFKVAPWTSEDGGAFPDGQHIALTHWSAGGVGDAATGTPVGVWQYCSEPSGEALEQFMIDYPYMDSPEPDAV